LQAAKETVGSGILGVLPAPPFFYIKLIPFVKAMLRSTEKKNACTLTRILGVLHQVDTLTRILGVPDTLPRILGVLHQVGVDLTLTAF
jgi:hypothetical protein